MTGHPSSLHTTVEAQIAHGERHGFPGYREGLTYGDGYKAALRASGDVRDAAIEALRSPQMQAVGQAAIRKHPHYESGPVSAYGFAGSVLKDVADALSQAPATDAAAPSRGTYLGYRSPEGHEMHCANAFCPHLQKCVGGCVQRTAVPSAAGGQHV